MIWVLAVRGLGSAGFFFHLRLWAALEPDATLSNKRAKESKRGICSRSPQAGGELPAFE